MPKYAGKLAAKMAADHYGMNLEDIDPRALHLIAEEGFSVGNYQDTKEVETQGVGQTREYKGKNFFTEVFPVFLNEAKAISPTYDSLPLPVQNAILSAVYRGDLQRTHKTAKYIRNGEWDKAAKEYLNHKDYRESKKKNQEAGKLVHGVQTRMERNAAAFYMMSRQNKK